jgi:hypothetical protein
VCAMALVALLQPARAHAPHPLWQQPVQPVLQLRYAPGLAWGG